MYNAIKDALLSKNCFVKWWVDDETTYDREVYKGLTSDAFAVLAADDDVEVVDLKNTQPPIPRPVQPATFYNATAQTKKTKRVRRVQTVPPEEMYISKLARTIQTSTYLAHAKPEAMADVLKRFPGHEEAIRNAAAYVSAQDNSEAFVRQTVQDMQDTQTSPDDVNKTMRKIEVCEHYIRAALKEDNIPRRYKITTVGTGYNVLEIDEISSWPFASGTAIIMPHRLFGRSLADLVIDIQQVKTSLLRATLNNAYFANNARTEARRCTRPRIPSTICSTTALVVLCGRRCQAASTSLRRSRSASGRCRQSNTWTACAKTARASQSTTRVWTLTV